MTVVLALAAVSPLHAQEASSQGAAGQEKIITKAADDVRSQLDRLVELEKTLGPLGRSFLTKAQYGLTLKEKVSTALEDLRGQMGGAADPERSFQVLVERVGDFGQNLPKAGTDAASRDLQNISVALERVSRVLSPSEQQAAHDVRRAAVETEFRAFEELLGQRLANAQETIQAGTAFLAAVEGFAAADETIKNRMTTLRGAMKNLEVANRRSKAAVLVPEETARRLEESERLAAQAAIMAIKGAGTIEEALALFDRRNKQVRPTLQAADSAAEAIHARHPGWINGQRINILVSLLILSGAILYYISQAQKGSKFFIRRIAGLSALDDAVGRATEMGRPIVFVTGIKDVDDVQTLAGMSILSLVARKAAEYDTKLFVPCCAPLAYSMAQEVVKESFLRAGRPDAYSQDDIRFLTSDQFGFVAGVDGIMVRERVAACFYLGKFYAESLILAETGNGIGAIQIAGTAETAQLPFFVAACDYTLIGEELFAASAYLSGEPRLLGSLRGQDVGKAIMIVACVVGALVQILISYEALPESLSVARLFTAR